MRTFHALLVSCLLVWGLGMARAQAPNGGLVLIIIDDLLYPEIQAPVDRLQADLQNEGYSARISQFTVAGKTPQDLWNTLVSEYNTEGQTLLGAILIGNLPKAKNTSTNQTTDAVYWNLQTFGPVGIRNIWVSRMSGTVLELERALQANHDYRTGVSHLPQTAHFKMLAYPESESYYYPNEGANALEVWHDRRRTHRRDRPLVQPRSGHQRPHRASGPGQVHPADQLRPGRIGAQAGVQPWRRLCVQRGRFGHHLHRGVRHPG
jgi:hypothetical protein